MPRRSFYLLLILAVPALAQDCTQSVPVLVVDGETGAPIADLTAEMLVARIREMRLPISATAHLRASRIIVLIDESGSMAGGGYVEGNAILALKHTLNDLTRKLPPGVSIEYGLFNTKWAFSETFVSDSAELRKSIDEVTSRLGKVRSGHTAIFDSLHEALNRFGAPRIGDSILLLTDGGDNSSKLGVKRLAQEFRAANARLLTIMVYEPSVISSGSGRDSIQSLVKQTGGSSLSLDVESLWWDEKQHSFRNTEMVRRFWNERVLSIDVIQVQVPGTLTKEAKWTISVNGEADARLKHAVVIHPTQLAPCAVAPTSAR